MNRFRLLSNALLAALPLVGCFDAGQPNSPAVEKPAGNEPSELAIAAKAIDTDEKSPYRINFSDNQRIPYFRNVALNDIPERTDITQAIIMVHGVGRDAGTMYDRVRDACGNPCNPASSQFNTLVVVPSFLTKEDVDTRYDGDPDLLHFEEEDWKIGYRSDNAARMGSFEVMDRILGIIKGKMGSRSLKLHLAGHSAGAQYMNRYAALSPDSPFSFTRYFVLAPSSYLYFNPRRIDDDGDEFTPTTCASYDNYRYGLKSMDFDYAEDHPFSIGRYTARRVVNLVGTKDVTSDMLDVSCQANRQGDNRLDRAKRYRIHVDKLAGSNRNVFLSVAGEGHPSRPLLESPEAGNTLFNFKPDSQIPWGDWQACDAEFGTKAGSDFCLLD